MVRVKSSWWPLNIRNNRGGALVPFGRDLLGIIQDRLRDVRGADRELELELGHAVCAWWVGSGVGIAWERGRRCSTSGWHTVAAVTTVQAHALLKLDWWRSGSVAANMAAGEIALRVGEDKGGDDVEEADDGGQDSGCNDYAPEREAKMLDVGGLLVEVTKDVETQRDHGHAKVGQSILDTQDWPSFGEVGL